MTINQIIPTVSYAMRFSTKKVSLYKSEHLRLHQEYLENLAESLKYTGSGLVLMQIIRR